ncbi:hypothetical protein [Prauserella flavalba]|uniref:hypothetical protein n=1 Tax=Prauserella flavalba TaxID=1477506 RepID=UPI0036E70E6C
MIDLAETPFEARTREQVESWYHHQFPLLRAYDELTREHNTHTGSIHEPPTGGLDTLAITELALTRIGKPPRDPADVTMAEAYLRGLHSEMATQYPSGPETLADAVARVEIALAGRVLRAEDFEAMSDVEREDHVDLLVYEMGGDPVEHLREALAHALPAIYRRITASDEARRRQLTVVE